MNSIVLLTIIVIGIILYSPITVDAKSYNIYVGKMPEHWKAKFGNLLYDATKWWENEIPGTKFYTVEQSRHADFMVQWASTPIKTDEGKNRLGYYTSNTINDYGLPYIQITLGYFEDGNWNLVDSDYALEITKHEIGHAMGFGHSDDQNNIMYPSLYNYDDWLSAKYSGLLDESFSPSKDVVTTYTHQSKELQEKTNSRVEQLKNSLYSKQDWLGTMNFETKEAKLEYEKAIKSLDEAKKYLSDAEWTQKEGETFLSQKSWENAYFKYLYTEKMTEKAWSPLSQVDSYVKAAQELEEQHKVEAPQEEEKFCFLFWCW